MKQLHLVIGGVLIVIAGGLGWFFGHHEGVSSLSQNQSGAMSQPISTKNGLKNALLNGVVQDNSGKTVNYWYDPMVPNQKFDKPGKSPFMDMQLQPKYANEGTNGGNTSEQDGVAISSQTVQNLGIRVERVSIQQFGETLSAIGRIEPDERRFYAVQTRIPGFVERLSVRAVGDPVAKGQKIAEIYAPELLAAQQEYLALLQLGSVDSDNSLRDGAQSRLKLLGMTEGEIVAISKSGKASPRFGVYAPASGILTELGVREGGQLMAGSSLVQISDLSQVWLIAEVPERDAARLKPGIAAEVQLQSLPTEVFKGKVGYLYPILNDTSRTLQVRIELPNHHNQLRPGMYANVTFNGQTHEALSVSSESIIATGKRKIVIVKEARGYRPVEVNTGQENNSNTEILSGLTNGEEVVVSGQFLIDSEASLSGVLARLSQQDAPVTPVTRDKPMTTMQDMHESNTHQEPVEKTPTGHGKVVDIDIKSAHITLNHEPIQALNWPAMTMGFNVVDPKVLNQLKVGDTVAFGLKAEKPQKPDMPTIYRIGRIEKVPSIKVETKDSTKEGMAGVKP